MIDTKCYSDRTCNSFVGLSCQGFTCQCDLKKKYWSETENKCVNLLRYDEHGCSSDKHCLNSDTQTLACINHKCN